MNMILSFSVCTLPLNENLILNQWSILHLMLLHKETYQDRDFSPYVSNNGFSSLDVIDSILKAVEWFIFSRWLV